MSRWRRSRSGCAACRDAGNRSCSRPSDGCRPSSTTARLPPTRPCRRVAPPIVCAPPVAPAQPQPTECAWIPRRRSIRRFRRSWSGYADGKILKGYTQDFHPSRPQFSLWPSVNATPKERIVVPCRALKAVFFVRDFEGNPGHRERKTFSVRRQGRRVEVTFTDGETMLGTTLNYRPDGQGFFVSPADPAATTPAFSSSRRPSGGCDSCKLRSCAESGNPFPGPLKPTPSAPDTRRGDRPCTRGAWQTNRAPADQC